MHRTAVFPGSFDPITKGHENVIIRAIPLFDRIIIGIGINSEKKSMFSLSQRKKWIEDTFTDYSTVSVEVYEGLTVDFCRKVGATFILRGLRTSADFEFERSIGQMNRALQPDTETIFMLTSPEFNALNSSIVREILKNGGNPDLFIPERLKGCVRQGKESPENNLKT